jgi:2,3-bisphosphoglycerate-dependent phosphoglycerate mutase
MADLIEITFLRHGRSLADDEEKYEGRYDSPLTQAGSQQAHIRGKDWSEKGVHFDLTISSPLIRAYETARLVANMLACPLEIDPDWMEIDHGPLAGMPRIQADRQYPRPAFRGPFQQAGGSGESEIDLSARASFALQRVIRRGPGRYLIVAHGGILNATLRFICGSPLPVNGTGIWFAFGHLGYAVVHYQPANHKWLLKELVPGLPVPD